ncbi:CocE/NonD family hydrolase [Halorarius litoreus]|uniref:CocE/NonD family hydrolase n=1 Tax=Halorarius litoreus TaxID=2962676 RepID=UPI0020CB7909|nr:CocE/NonD family hydrolase [Halorarius litoreus]
MDLTRRDALRAGGLALAGTFATGTASAAVTTRDLRIDSWDGTELAATLFRPPGSDEHPALLMTHGWGLDRSTAEARAQTYAQNGYVVLTYDSRGFGESEGQVGVDGPNEVQDAQALITWLADQSRVRADGDDPVVGMDGESYAGGIQLNTAAVDDRLDAIVPRWCWHDLRYSLEPNGRPLDGAENYEDGVVKVGWAAALFGLGTAGSRGVTAGGNNHPDTYDTEGLSPRIHEALVKGLATNDIPDDEEAWFRARSPSHKLADIDIPTLLISGWIDTLFTPKEAVANFRGLRETGTDARLLLFNGGHVAGPGLVPGNAHTDAAALAWLDTHLKGDGQSDRPVVEVFDEQTGTYRPADDIEPVGRDDPSLTVSDVLGSGSTPIINSVAPTSTSHFSPEDRDATEATAMRIDIPIERDTTVFGAPEVELTATLLGPEARLFLKAYHVTNDGATLIDGQVTPTRLTGAVGTTVSETVAMEPFYRRFAAGDTLRFVVATSDSGHATSRESAGVEVDHDATTIRYPTQRALGRPGANGPRSR